MRTFLISLLVILISSCESRHSPADTDPTIVIAREVLENAGLSETQLILTQDNQRLTSEEGYIIGYDKGKTTIRAKNPIGLLYGAFAAKRMQHSGILKDGLDTVENPFYSIRLLNHWDNLDGTIERGYAGRSLWKWDELPDTISPRLEEYALKCAEVGINGAVLNNVNASPQILTREYLQKVKGLADFLRPYGVKVYLSVNFATPLALGELSTADPLDPEVEEWWKTKVSEIYSLIPDFGGFLVKANSEGQPGPCDYGRSHSEGANMLADALTPYGGTVMWRAFVYSPTDADRAKQAYQEFKPLDGQFRDNVIIQIKNGPVDFQPREPYSPLFGSMPATNEMAEFQITQEYLGHANHLAYLAPMWEEFFEYVKPASIKGLAGVANIGDSEYMTGNPLADANRYAFGRLSWNPYLTSEKIINEWTDVHLFENPNGVPDSIKNKINGMFLDSREAVVEYMMPLGLHHIFAGNHHYGPEPWYYVEGIRSDWTPMYYHQAGKDGIGFERSHAGSNAVSQYPDSLRILYDDIETCPEELLLWFHHVPWNHKMKSGNTLWEELCLKYQNGIDKVDSWQEIWEEIEPYVNKEIYLDGQRRLSTQLKDAEWWRDACLLYFGEYSGLPRPQNIGSPKKKLEEYMKIQIPISNFESPSDSLLDLYR